MWHTIVIITGGWQLFASLRLAELASDVTSGAWCKCSCPAALTIHLYRVGNVLLFNGKKNVWFSNNALDLQEIYSWFYVRCFQSLLIIELFVRSPTNFFVTISCKFCSKTRGKRRKERNGIYLATKLIMFFFILLSSTPHSNNLFFLNLHCCLAILFCLVLSLICYFVSFGSSVHNNTFDIT